MSAIKIEIETDNAAFEGSNRRHEVARILRRLAKDIADNGLDSVSLRDVNGNKVGSVEVSE